MLTGCSRHPGATATPPQTVTFAGFTNGYIGAIAPVFARLTTNHAAAIQQWLAAGTNNALFTITNQQKCDINIFPIGRIHTSGANPTDEQTPILNAPNFSGIRLKPGQVTNLQVAVLPHQAPWRFQVNYTRTDQHVGFLEGFNALILRKPIITQTIPIDSDMIDRSP